jgi:hypothetical protein
MTTLVKHQGKLSFMQVTAVTRALSELMTLVTLMRDNWINGGKVTRFKRERTKEAREERLRDAYRRFAEEAGFTVTDDRRNGHDFSKLAKLLGMMSSDHGGERDNAISLIEQERKRLGMTWPEILGCSGPQHRSGSASGRRGST